VVDEVGWGAQEGLTENTQNILLESRHIVVLQLKDDFFGGSKNID
jgi:hypothetical protein